MTVDRRAIIGVMGSHENQWDDLSSDVGALIAEHDYHLLTGAGGGVMTAVARAFTEVEGRMGLSLGVVPTVDYRGGYVSRDDYPNPYIELPILTPLDKKVQGDSNPMSRNYVNVMTSSAMIILPGEHGTMNEASLAIQYNKLTILYGPEDEFTRFPDQLTRVDHVDEVREFLAQVRKKVRIDESEEDE